MELNKIKELLEKYFEGNLSEKEEQLLKTYFSQEIVAEHLQKYKPLFAFFAEAKQSESTRNFRLNDNQNNKKSRNVTIGIAASLLIAIGTVIFMFSNNQPTTKEDLGTFNDPKVALQETQKALSLLSKHVNTGYESVQYIDEYEITRDKLFNLN